MNNAATFESRFREFNEKTGLFTAKSKILLACSGGLDSVVLAHLFHIANIKFGIAHVNYQLRGKESDADEAFCKSLSSSLNMPFYNISFDTQLQAEKSEESIQMIARRLRYEWLEEIRVNNTYQYIATAHHLNDSLETVILNIAKGTGIKGLKGIAAKKGRLIRPLLFAGREELESYARETDLKWREDSSNDSLKYERNIIRHKIIPVLEELNPALIRTYSGTKDAITMASSVYEKWLARKIKFLCSRKNDELRISIKGLLKEPQRQSILHEIIHPLGFSKTQELDILRSLDGQSGAEFSSTSHRIIKDRRFLYLHEIDMESPRRHYLKHPSGTLELDDGILEWELVPVEELKIIPDPNKAYIAADELCFPLLLRRWEKGDHFYPFGMKKKKKLSDFFIDEKIAKHHKELIWLLFDQERLLWVVGMRADERTRIKKSATRALSIEFFPSR